MRNKRLQWIHNYHLTHQNHKWQGRNVLLFGSEGFGLRHQTLKHSDFQFKISINKNVESLNISNSVAIVCHHINHILKKNA